MTDPVREAAQRLLDECDIIRSHEDFSLKPHPDTVEALRQALQAPTSVERPDCGNCGSGKHFCSPECVDREQLPQSEEGRGEPSENLPSAVGGGKAKRPETLSEYFDLMPEGKFVGRPCEWCEKKEKQRKAKRKARRQAKKNEI